MDHSEKSHVRSCVTCAKAKAKCVRPVGAHICERCARLHKECQWKEAVVRRRKPTKTTRTAQLEKLESKIENLVNALSTQQQQQAYRSPLENPQSHSSPPDLQTPQNASLAIARSHELMTGLCAESQSHRELIPHHDAGPELSTDEAEILLDRYRRLMSNGMPFVIVPEISAANLSEQKPVLLRAICTVALFHDLARQKKYITDLNREIAERMLLKNEKSIDVLQAILVLVAWYHPHIFWSPQITNLLHLASALIIDMGIDRPPTQTADFKQAAAKAVHGPNLVQKVHTLEEKRLLLCVFHQINTLSSSFRKLDSMPFTPYMEQCLTSLEQAREYDSDAYLVQSVRVQRVTEQIHTTDVSNTPSRVYIRAFQADLERLRRSDTCKDDNVFTKLQYLAAEIMMWELSLSELQEHQSRSRSLTAHLEDLYHCVTAIKAFLEAFFSIPTSTYYLLPFTVLGEFAHVFICLTKIASLEIEGWNIHALNEHVNFLEAVAECGRRFDASTRASPDGIALNNDSFAKWAAKVRWMKSVFEAKFAQELCSSQVSPLAEETVQQQQQQQQLLQQPTPPDDPLLSAEFFNYLDESFWDGFGELDAVLFPGVEVS